jgi:predicted Na+-dependent transporter
VLPLLLPGVEVDAGKIALTLIVTMLVPLIIGLLIKARYEGAAGEVEPVMAQISTISLALLLVLMLGSTSVTWLPCSAPEPLSRQCCL